MALVELVIKIACVTLYRLPAGSLNVANGETQTSNVVGNPVGNILMIYIAVEDIDILK